MTRIQTEKYVEILNKYNYQYFVHCYVEDCTLLVDYFEHQNTFNLSFFLYIDKYTNNSCLANVITLLENKRYEFKLIKLVRNAGELQIVPNSCPYSLIQVSADKAYVPTFNLGNIMVVDTKTMTKTGEIDLTKYAHADNSPEPACGIVRDGILYLALDQLGSNWMPYDDYRQVDVALIDIKSDKVLKIISEKKSEFALPTRPFLKNMIFMDEQNDIYMACLGYFGYNPQHPNNGFVCIPNGKQEFDESKSWNINETAIEGSPYKAASIYNCKYLGNGKIAAYVGISELMTDNPYTARNSMAVIIDLKKKSIKKIEGIPYTDGHSVAIESKGNDVLFASCGVDASGVFDYNVETGKVSQVLSTSANVAFMHFFD